jgi:hypothetical protein
MKARDGHGRYIRSAQTVEQDRRAAELRSASLSLDQIAAELGVHRTTAGRAADRGLLAIATDSESLAAAKANELLKLDRRERRLWTEYGKEQLTPEQLGTLNGAFDRVAKRRADLLGLDEPNRSEITVLTNDVVDAAILKLEAELAERGGGSAPVEAPALEGTPEPDS